MIDTFANFLGYERQHEISDYGMERYPENSENEPVNYVTIKSIEVSTERDRTELLKACQYLHDNRLIDTDYYAVNTLVHVYERPELIKVVNSS